MGSVFLQRSVLYPTRQKIAARIGAGISPVFRNRDITAKKVEELIVLEPTLTLTSCALCGIQGKHQISGNPLVLGPQTVLEYEDMQMALLFRGLPDIGGKTVLQVVILRNSGVWGC